MRSRPFLSRLLLAGLGMVVFCLAGLVGVGWAVREPSDWVIGRLGEDRSTHLRGAYTRALGGWLPADSDGDGFPDSVERYLGSDPRDPLSPSADLLHHADQGFTASEVDHSPPITYPDVLLQPGERRRIHARVGIFDEPAVFSQGMRLRLRASLGDLFDPLFCLPGGTPSRDPLLVPVASDGAVEFDLTVASDTATADLWETGTIWIEHPIAGNNCGQFFLRVAWRQPPIPFTVREIPPDSPVRDTPLGGKLKGPVVHLAWQPASFSGPYYIEATRDESGREWFTVTVCSPKSDHAVIRYELNDAKPGHRGPLKFRVIPTKSVPTKE